MLELIIAAVFAAILIFLCGCEINVMRMDEEEDDLCTPHKLFNLFSMCTLPSTTTTQTKMEAGADDSDIRQDLHHSSVVGDHIYNSFMFVVFMHFSLYY